MKVSRPDKNSTPSELRKDSPNESSPGQSLRSGGPGESGEAGPERPHEGGHDPRRASSIKRFGVFTAVLAALFSIPLWRLVQHALDHSLHSHIVLIPVVSAYLVYRGRDRLPGGIRSSIPGMVLFASAGAALLGWALLGGEESLGINDWIALMTASFLAFFVAGLLLLLGGQWLKRMAFPVGFLLFMIPLPDGAVELMERGLMLASADVSAWLFQLSGTPIFRSGQVLEIPGITLEVAEECSGIRSTWVLFITSVVAAHLLLRANWRRAILMAVVIPLGILRNGLRILVIGLLCVHYGPHMIDSLIHREGGPVFFGITLVPFFVILWWLRRREARGLGEDGGTGEAPGGEARPGA